MRAEIPVLLCELTLDLLSAPIVPLFPNTWRGHIARVGGHASPEERPT